MTTNQTPLLRRTKILIGFKNLKIVPKGTALDIVYSLQRKLLQKVSKCT